LKFAIAHSWGSYFGLAETPSTFERIDSSWLHRRLRQVRWTEWKRPKARRHNLIVLGSSAHDARPLGRKREGTLAHVGLATTLPNPE